MYAVSVAAPAADQIRTALAWWREHRPAAPRLLTSELVRALRQVRDHPMAGRKARRRPDLRRVVLARVGYVLFYRVDESRQQVVVLALWHASRGARPRLPR